MNTDPQTQQLRRPGDLLHCRDVTVRNYLQAWSLGMYKTFEEMLVALCCGLVNEKEELAAQVCALMERKP